MNTRRVVGACLLVGLGVCLVHCRPSQRMVKQGDQLLQAGRYRESAALFEQLREESQRLLDEDLLMFRAGLAYYLSGRQAHPQAAAHAKRATALFRRLVAEYPQSLYKSQAQLLLEQQQRLTHCTATISRLERQLAAAKVAADQASDTLQNRLKSAKDQLDSRIEGQQLAEKQIAVLTQQVQALSAELATRKARIDELQQKLSDLKRIDMRRNKACD